MKNEVQREAASHLVVITLSALLMVGCSFSPLSTPQRAAATTESATLAEGPSPAQPEAPLPESVSTIETLQPYPYTTPLPSPVPTELDGLYTRTVKFEGTPTPCRRCAPYRAEGGTWTLHLNAGVLGCRTMAQVFRG